MNPKTMNYSVLWIEEGTWSTIPKKDVTSEEPVIYSEATAKFHGSEHAVLILCAGSKAICEKITKNGAECEMISQIKCLKKEIVKKDLQLKCLREDGEAIKSKLHKSGSILKKMTELKPHLCDILNSSKKVEELYLGFTGALVIEEGNFIFDNEFPTIKMTEVQRAQIQLSIANSLPDKTKTPHKKARPNLIADTILQILFPDKNWLGATHSEMILSHPIEMGFILKQCQKHHSEENCLLKFQSLIRNKSHFMKTKVEKLS